MMCVTLIRGPQAVGADHRRPSRARPAARRRLHPEARGVGVTRFLAMAAEQTRAREDL